MLIATRRCVSRLKDLTSDEVVDFFLVVHKIQRALETYYGTTSSTVTVQDGEQAGQTVKVSNPIVCEYPKKNCKKVHNRIFYFFVACTLSYNAKKRR